MQEFDCEGVRDALLRAPLGYKPMNGLDDLVWNKYHNEDVQEQDKTLMPANEPVSSNQAKEAKPVGEGARLA